MADCILRWNSEYDDYLRDESRSEGAADSISFPKTEAEVVSVVKAMSDCGKTITTQGARTGIVAGAVPHGGHILNLSRMNAIGDVRRIEETGEYRITVQPGALLSNIQRVVEGEGLFFPPDPTETSASIGGMVACNASGAMSFFYGPTRKWVHALRVILSDGSAVRLCRGQNVADGRDFSVETEDGRVISGRLPDYVLPDVKTAAGYYTAAGMDMIDLFIGMEGTLGIITEIELRLIRKPKALVAINAFFPSEAAAIAFVRALRGEEVDEVDAIDSMPVAIEFFNSHTLNLLRRMRSEYPAFAGIPEIKPQFHTAVYAEFHGGSDESLEEIVVQVIQAMSVLGASDEDAWCATSDRELEPLKAFRHATPEAVNLLIGERRKSCSGLTKLGTDMSVPDCKLSEAMRMYNEGLESAGLESVIFGHIGDNHLHVNILPRDMAEYEAGKNLYQSWAVKVVEMGGSVSAEHGIGKIKASYLALMYGEAGISQMRALKSLFDAGNLLNPGDLF